MRFPYERFRRGQKESIIRISKYLGNFIVLKAPTGFGKTIVAILSHSSADNVLYVVRTINEIAPVIRELRRAGIDFTFVYSGRRMCPLLKGSEVDPNDFWINCKVVRNRRLCSFYERLSSVSITDITEVLKGSSIDPREIVNDLISKLSVCPFFALTRLIPKSHFTIATYPYLFKEDVYRTAFSNGLDEFYVIIDEAHTILNPQSIYEEELSDVDVNQALREARAYSLGSEVVNFLRDLINVVSKIRSRMLKRLEKAFIYPGEGFLQILEDAIIDIRLKRLKEFLESPETIVRISTKLTKVLKFLSTIKDQNFEAYGISDVYGKRIKALPVSYEPIRSRLEVAKGVLMMSGTMPPKLVIDKILGKESQYIDVESDYGEVFPHHHTYYAVYAETTSSYHRRSTYMYSKYAELITKVYDSLTRGIVLTVHPSYQFMNEVVSRIDVKINQVVEDPYTSLSEVLSKSLSYDKVIIHAVASGKVTEGIEIIDPRSNKSLINVVIIAGVPYPQPDDYVKDLRRNLVKEFGRELADKLVMDIPAVIKVLQAIGRAVRSERDRAFIVLADRRFLSRELKALLNIRYDLVTTNLAILARHIELFTKGFL